MSATGSVTAVLAAVLLLTACGGAPEVPATVGPTAGADPELTYEPTSFPYEATMELTAEERAELDELTLLIDEYTEYTSGSTDYHREGLDRLRPQLSEEVIIETEEFLDEVENQGIETRGRVLVADALIDRYQPGESAEVWICFDYSEYERVNGREGSSRHQDDSDFRLFLYQAKFGESNWVLTADLYDGPTCEALNG